MGRNWGPTPKWAWKRPWPYYGLKTKTCINVVYSSILAITVWFTLPQYRAASPRLYVAAATPDCRRSVKSQKSSYLSRFLHTDSCTKMADGSTNPVDYKNAKSIYEFSARDINGDEVSMDKYKDHVVLVVNVATKCGLTETNYNELNELHDSYADSKGLRILAFPCNQFAGQEPGSNEDICAYAKKRQVKFDMFEKINVNGDGAHPLWKYLKDKTVGTLGSFIKWNFTKFIVDKQGQPVERHGPNTNPKDLVNSLEKYW